jgi:hypothetical protein
MTTHVKTSRMLLSGLGAIALARAVAPVSARAGLILETATLGQPGGGSPQALGTQQWFGARFLVTTPTAVDHIGGHFYGIPVGYGYGHFYGFYGLRRRP